MKSRAACRTLVASMVLFALLLAAVASLTSGTVRAGDGAFKLRGFVWNCATDPGRMVFSDTMPEDCSGGDSPFTIVTQTDDGVAGNTAFPDATGFYEIEDGTPATTSLRLGVTPSDGLAGAMSCYYLQDNIDVSQALLPLDADGSAEILAGQTTWNSAFCIIAMFPAPGDQTSPDQTADGNAMLSGSILTCDADVREGATDQMITDHCQFQTDPLTVIATNPDGMQQETESDDNGSFSFPALPVGLEYMIAIKDRPASYGTVAGCGLITNPVLDGDPSVLAFVRTVLPSDVADQDTGDDADNADKTPNTPQVLDIQPDDPASPDANLPGFPVSVDVADGLYGCTFVLMPFDPGTVSPNTTNPDSNTGSPTDTAVAEFDALTYTCTQKSADTTVDELWDTCTEMTDPVEFALTGSETGTNLTKSTGTDAPGAVFFVDLAADTYTLTATLPDGYGGSLVFCSLYDGNGSTEFLKVSVADQTSISKSLAGVDAFSCEWFFIPMEVPDSGAPSTDTGTSDTSDTDSDTNSEAGETTGPVEFDASFYTCNTEPSGDSLDDFWNTCDLTSEPIDVSMTASTSGQTLTQTTGTIIDSGVIFDGIPEADWLVSAVSPDGFGSPTVFCAVWDGVDQGPYAPAAVDENGAITASLQDPDAMTCEWFFLPGSEESTGQSGAAGKDGASSSETGTPGRQKITIILRNCPVLYRGIDWDTDCVDAAKNVRFAVLGDGVENGEVDIVTDDQGMVVFDLPYTGSDIVLVEEATPETIGLNFLTGCVRDGQSFETPFMPAYIVSDASNVQLIVPNGSAITCTWINIPSQAQMVRVPVHPTLGGSLVRSGILWSAS